MGFQVKSYYVVRIIGSELYVLKKKKKHPMVLGTTNLLTLNEMGPNCMCVTSVRVQRKSQHYPN